MSQMTAMVRDEVPRLGRCLCLPGEEVLRLDPRDDSQADEENEESEKSQRGQEVIVDRELEELDGIKTPATRNGTDNLVHGMEKDPGIKAEYFAVRIPDLRMYRVW